MVRMRILLTGASGSIGSALLPRLVADGHDVRAFARDPARVAGDVDVVRGDALTGSGLDHALEGIDVAYFLIHSMEGDAAGFGERERTTAANFVAAARRAGLRRAVYLGGPVPAEGDLSPHLRSRLEVERALLAGVPEAIALRASIVIGAQSRSFRFLVRLVERLPILALPSWRTHRTRPIDARDVTGFLAAAATTSHGAGGLSLDIAGPDVLTYGEMIERIADIMLVARPVLRLPFEAAPLAASVAAAISGEDIGLIAPLMGSLSGDLLPRDERAGPLLGVLHLHSFDHAVERALREWEAVEELAAR